MVHLVEDEDFGVAWISRYEKGHDLAGAILQMFVSASHSAEHYVDVVGMLPLSDNVLTGTVLPLALRRKPIDQALIIFGKVRKLHEFLEQWAIQYVLL